jgi:hypothetical protein
MTTLKAFIGYLDEDGDAHSTREVDDQWLAFSDIFAVGEGVLPVNSIQN